MSTARRPTKVLHVLNGASGGAAMSTLGLIAELEKQGIASCAVCIPAGSDAERERLRAAVHGDVLFTPLYWWNEKIRHTGWKRPLAELRQIARTGWARGSAHRVARAAERWRADLIHSNTIVTLEGGIAAGMLGVPHVWHIRELIGRDKPFRFRREGRAFGDYVARRASKVIANSNVTASLVRDGFVDHPGVLEIVPNGIELGGFVSLPTPAERPHRDKLVVAMVAGMTARWKKHDVFVKAALAALAADPSLPVEFRIYGHDPSAGGTQPGGDYIDVIHAMIAAAGARDRFAWPGHVNDPRAVMRDVDILAHSADHESFGRVIVEGMAAGLPVIGANGGGVAELVVDPTALPSGSAARRGHAASVDPTALPSGSAARRGHAASGDPTALPSGSAARRGHAASGEDQTGVLFPPDDHAAMAAAIIRVARDRELAARFGAAGRARALAKYTLEACANGVIAVYEAAMARPVEKLGALGLDIGPL